MRRFKVVYAPEAVQEIINIVEFYNSKQKGLGDRFKRNLLAEIALIKQNPFTRSFRYDDVRFAVIRHFPFAAHYTVDESSALIKIQAVLGFAQDSEANWKVRL
jgi:toxin ParE1/3/4